MHSSGFFPVKVLLVYFTGKFLLDPTLWKNSWREKSARAALSPARHTASALRTSSQYIQHRRKKRETTLSCHSHRLHRRTRAAPRPHERTASCSTPSLLLDQCFISTSKGAFVLLAHLLLRGGDAAAAGLHE